MTIERPGYARRYTAPTRLRHVRQLLADRTERKTAKDILYVAYASILTAGIIGYPTVSVILTNLTVPRLVEDLAESLIERPVIAACLAAVVMAGMLVIGRFRGPVVPPLPYLTLVAGSPIPRRLALRRRWFQSVAIGVIVTIAAATIAVVVQGQISTLSGPGIALTLAAAIPAGVIFCCLWLIGQSGDALRRNTLAGLGGVSVTLGILAITRSLTEIALWSGPWGWMTVLWQGIVAGPGTATWLAFAFLLLTAAMMAMGSVRILDHLAAPEMAVQARRWNAAHTLAVTGDIRAAAGRLRPAPRWGRRWQSRFGRQPHLAVLRRDLIGLARSWSWTVFSAGGLVAGSAALAYSTGPFGAHTLLPYLAAIIVYLGAGGLSGGLRTMADLVGSPSNFGIGQRQLVLLHSVIPMLVGALLAGATGLAVSMFTPDVSGLTAAGWCALVAVFCVGLNALSALKGPLPAEYLSPVPSPMGDFSGVLVLMWLSDAVIVVVAVAGTLTARIALGHGAVTSVIWLMVAAVAVVMWARSRLSRHLQPQG